ncbi:MAG: hypothetical protein QOF75_431, partial [Gaiellaceae bacterium]|nr:hypothetical protein [Gaiellaceae bacterium]
LFNDEYGGALIAEIVGYVSLTSQQLSEYHMAKFSDARGEMWTPIPYSVLADEEWTSTVGPMRPGTSSLPPKTAPYTTTRGKLSLEECNRLAREFRPAAWHLRHYDDDAWIKNHPGDPRAAELYRTTHAGSVVLRDRGADVSQADLEELRAAARVSREVPATS